MSDGKHIVFYDGVCVMCNGAVRFIHENDRRDIFQFAPLQSQFAQERLARHGRNAAALESIYVLIDSGTPNERAVWKFQALTFIMGQLGLRHRLLSALMKLVPRPLGDWYYDRIGRTRYDRFGKYDECPVPPPEMRRKCLHVA